MTARYGVAAQAAADPNRIALVDSTGLSSAEERRISFAALHDRSLRAAQLLAALGVRAGDSIAVAFRNRPQYFETMTAAWWLRAFVVPVAWRSQRDEVDYYLTDSGARVLLAEDDLPQPTVNAQVLTLHQYDAALTEYAAEPLGPAPDDPEILSRPYTSGTTGRPKAIERATGGGLQPDTFLGQWGLAEPGGAHLLCAPMYHSQPRAFAQFGLDLGHTVVMMDRFDAELALHLINREQITWSSMAPIHFVRILQLAPEVRARYDTSSLRLVLHSAAPCPPDVKWAMMDVFPRDVLWELYGGTEGLTTVIGSQEWRTKPGTVGRAARGVTVHILDDDGRELPAGTVGHVYTRRNDGTRPFHYRNAPQSNTETWRGDAYTLGEMGYLDDDGYLFLTDRAKDMIVIGGSNVYPAEVEAVMIGHPDVVDVAVIGVPDATLGEAVKAIVQPRDTARVDPDALLSYVRSRLASYKCPTSIDFVETLPREPSGKLRKRELRAPYWQGRARSI